jgi:hypothetical protein
MTDTDQKKILLFLSELLSGLYTQQAAIVGLLSRKLPDISEEEKKVLEDNAKRNSEIAESCEAVTKLIEEM